MGEEFSGLPANSNIAHSFIIGFVLYYFDWSILNRDAKL